MKIIPNKKYPYIGLEYNYVGMKFTIIRIEGNRCYTKPGGFDYYETVYKIINKIPVYEDIT